jgi:hypothetical protein
MFSTLGMDETQVFPFGGPSGEVVEELGGIGDGGPSSCIHAWEYI